ncbi:MAG: hypothetical protein DU480_05220 [Nitrosomonas sp.]|uniref:hypothetical protein n=1 Tax=Nitrosomonas sp. TaxID=42353 RepID=UPI0032EC7FE2
MNNFFAYFRQAELALAAYAKNLEIGRPAIENLQNAEFSDNQARAFADSYNVVDQFNDAATGLSATVFADSDKNTFLAVRGTELTDIRDFATGVFDIMLFGSTQLHPQYNSVLKPRLLNGWETAYFLRHSLSPGIAWVVF